MRNIISAYGILFVLVLSLYLCANVVSAAGQAAAAQEYKADVVAELEDSNFSPNVIAACISQASAAGYTLEVRACTYDEDHNIQTAEVVLTYSYQMPLLGIEEQKTTRGIAR